MTLKELRRIFKDMTPEDQKIIRDKVYAQMVPFHEKLSEMIDDETVSYASAKKINAEGMKKNIMWRVVLGI